jgi:hypothetical protein
LTDRRRKVCAAALSEIPLESSGITFFVNGGGSVVFHRTAQHRGASLRKAVIQIEGSGAVTLTVRLRDDQSGYGVEERPLSDWQSIKIFHK